MAKIVTLQILVDEDDESRIADGLNDMLEDEEILALVERGKKRLDGAAEALVDAANEAGGKDNVTALLAHVLEA